MTAASAGTDEKPHGLAAWLRGAWGPITVFVLMQIGTLIFFEGGNSREREAQATERREQLLQQQTFNTEFKAEMKELNASVHEMNTQLGNLNASYGRIDEHVKGIEQRVNTHDHRIDKIEEWKR